MMDGVYNESFRSSTVRWIRGASLVLLTLMLPPETEAAGGTTELEHAEHADVTHADPDLLWAGVEHNRLAFLPESLLRDTPLDQLPLGEAEQAILRSAIDMARPVGMTPVCLGYHGQTEHWQLVQGRSDLRQVRGARV